MQSWIMHCVLTYSQNKVFPTIFEVTDTQGLIILGRKQAKAMGYVQYSAIKPPNTIQKASKHKVCAGMTHNPKWTLKINMFKWT